jgi:hypothetical protein
MIAIWKTNSTSARSVLSEDSRRAAQAGTGMKNQPSIRNGELFMVFLGRPEDDEAIAALVEILNCSQDFLGAAGSCTGIYCGRICISCELGMTFVSPNLRPKKAIRPRVLFLENASAESLRTFHFAYSLAGAMFVTATVPISA